MTYTNEEYQVYLRVQKALLLEDARNFVADYLAYRRDVEPEDIDEEELNAFDYDALISEYEEQRDCNVSFNSTWESIVDDYMYDYDIEEA